MKLKGMHSICAIIVICAIIATVQAASAAPGTAVSVEPSYLSVSQGDTFTVDITINSTDYVYGAQYTLYFNNILLKVLDQSQGSFLGGNIMKNDIDNPNGMTKYGECRTGSEGVTGNGTLATIEFEVRCSGVGELRLDNVKLSKHSGEPLPREVNNATVDIAQSPPPTSFLIHGYVSYENGSECNNPAVNITNLNIGTEWTAETSGDYYQLTLESCADVIAGEILQLNVTSPDGSSNITEHTVTQAEVGAGGFEYNITLEYRPGDINGDGRITPADAAIVLQMAVCGDYSNVADVDHDDSVTSLDALMILQAVDENITFRK